MFQALRAAAEVARTHPWLLGRLALAVSLPTALATLLAGSGELSVQLSALFTVLNPISGSALLYALSEISGGREPTWRESIGIGLRSWHRFVAARFCANLLIGLGLLCCVVPGVLLLIRYALLEQVVAFEGAGIRDARRRSFTLARGLSGQIVGVAVVVFLGFLLLMVPVLLLSIVEPLENFALALFTAGRGLAVGFLTIVLWALYATGRSEQESIAAAPRFVESPTESGSSAPAYALAVAVALLVASVPAIRWSLWDWNDIASRSMQPGILEGDRVLVERKAYDLHVPFTRRAMWRSGDPELGDLVVFRSPETGIPMLKRVVGLPGDRLEIREEWLIRNGVAATYHPLDSALFEGLQVDPSARLFVESMGNRSQNVVFVGDFQLPSGPFEVPEGSYFVVGDNRNNSRDSRFFGAVDRDDVLGRATHVALSFDYGEGFAPRIARFFTALD